MKSTNTISSWLIMKVKGYLDRKDWKIFSKLPKVLNRLQEEAVAVHVQNDQVSNWSNMSAVQKDLERQ